MPAGLVVKKGSASLARTSEDMPHPVSDTTRRIPPDGAGASEVSDPERAPGRHGIAGVQEEIHEDLLEGRRIAPDSRETWIEGGEDVNPFPAQMLAREEERVLHDVRQIDGVVIKLALPAEGEEALGDVAESLGVPVEDLQVDERLRGQVLLLPLQEHHLEAGEDDADRVVELVGNAGGHAAERRQLLDVPHLPVLLDASGDVRDERHGEAVLVIGHDAQTDLDGELGPVAAPARQVEPDPHGARARLRKVATGDQTGRLESAHDGATRKER